MTEAEWLACGDPQKMLDVLWKVSDRKLRLFGCAFCRWNWTILPEEFRAAVVTAEQFADRLVTTKQLGVAKRTSGAILPVNIQSPRVYRACSSAWSTTRNAATAAIYPCWVFTDAADIRYQIATLRDIFGNPFRPVALDPRWLTFTAVALADGIYTDRAFDRLPILADALEEAGCDNADVLAHCRGDGPHVRGCWVVDLVLGKS